MPERADRYQQLPLTGECPAGKASLEQANLGQRGGGRHPCTEGISCIEDGEGQYIPICLDWVTPGGSVNWQKPGIPAPMITPKRDRWPGMLREGYCLYLPANVVWGWSMFAQAHVRSVRLAVSTWQGPGGLGSDGSEGGGQGKWQLERQCDRGQLEA
eukprot:2773484-Rhodomonas_salina.1